MVKGYITFVNVDAINQPLPHGITIVADTIEEQELFETGRTFR